MRITMFLAAVVLSIAAAAFADTLIMKDGTSLDGAVVRSDAETVVVQMGSGNVSFPAGDVVRIEQNDKKGDVASLSIMRGKAHQDSIDQRTGLTAEQRSVVQEAIDPLWSPDEGQRNTARKKLVQMGQQMPVFQYIESYLPFSKGLVAPELMKVLFDLDPQRARSVCQPYASNPDPGNRAQALELMAKCRKDDDIDTVAQGLVDLDSSVQARAAHALGEAASKRATPALIEAMSSADPKVKNAAQAALERVWSTKSIQVSFDTVEEWKSFWAGRARTVKNPIDPASLEPLVSKENLAKAGPSHDE